MPEKLIEFDTRVSNPLGYEFLVDLMLFSFNEFDVIIGMDWLIVHDAIVNCTQKRIVLKCQNDEIVNVETD
ncbi:hypothetical protein EPI10_020721 [Gossypium australe]|uniref:Uncharacterized protein n=1 Tax=Gossypium australe TaxID=47621 RepID=A0A5B6WFR4_9ROSI|nr:hypothetical protein EPI10_020721 [Gossypium australe]